MQVTLSLGKTEITPLDNNMRKYMMDKYDFSMHFWCIVLHTRLAAIAAAIDTRTHVIRYIE